MERSVSLIKEYRINDILKKALVCFDEHIFDRAKQRACVLELYKTSQDKDISHWDKSIFRGMVIPSLKYLGLIYGEGDSLKISANGKIAIESQRRNQELHERALRAIIYEIDINQFHVLKKLIDSNIRKKDDFLIAMSAEISGTSPRQRRERVTKWLLILNEVGLINFDRTIILNHGAIEKAISDIEANQKEAVFFENSFFNAYKDLSKDNPGIIKIEEIRKKVCLDFLSRQEILTEFQFDVLLRKIPFESNKYLISLGKPMGAQEKLFEYNNTYYNTLYIKYIS